ncbi:hypothetical protein NIES2134_121760 [Thermostichus vulcanus NIES-2134]|nr:hypothetical protein NIES2134_121760 [Thermostichus vulcanus NIES-2134]
MFSLESPANSLEQVMGHLSPAEQIRMLMHHPYFTGRCPACRQPIHHSQLRIGQCYCSHCGWQDHASDRQSMPTFMAQDRDC